jgi:hypothetical protein
MKRKARAAGAGRKHDSVNSGDEIKTKAIKSKIGEVVEIYEYILRCKNEIKMMRGGEIAGVY